MEGILYEGHLRNARLYRDGGDFEKALAHVDRALALRQSSEEARALRVELQRLAGDRAGEVRTYLEDEWLAQKAREEQRAVEARRWLKQGKAAEEAGDFDRAIAAYERALFLAGEDRDLRAEIEKAR
jgi:tetratricopeptide (TPR) repeat protein